jgi:cobalt-zinc-cadmium efflux system membrane fusion protein
MYMNAEVEVTSSTAFVMPNEALVRFEGKEYVFEQTEAKQYQLQEVHTQNPGESFTQVSFADSSHIGERVFVLKGAYTLLMKMENTVQE